MALTGQRLELGANIEKKKNPSLLYLHDSALIGMIARKVHLLVGTLN